MKTLLKILALGAVTLGPISTQASTAYGDLNNFDVINDTGVECHGFEIELEDVHSRDITYTYDWNHYGTPKITEDNTDPLHPRVTIRYGSQRQPNGTWSAYTAVPTRQLAPTDGHCCTNPALNDGCEHFGVGYYGSPTVVRYHWLVDDGSGNLVRGPMVNIATPTFVYYAPVPAVAPAQVQAAIVPPEPAEIPLKEFGEAVWVKEIRTSSHNARKVKLEDLVSDDPDKVDEKNWKNGEPDEVEVEWQLLQADYNSVGGENEELKGAPENLNNGDEVITRRYEFFKYVGPVDAETGEAIANKVGDDGLHGSGTKEKKGVVYDFSTMVVVGDYVGAQMAGFDAVTPLGLIQNLQNGELNVPYVERTVVVGGNMPYVAYLASGSLPQGMDLDLLTGILSGTPTESGVFSFQLEAFDSDGLVVQRNFTLTIDDLNGGGGGGGDPVVAPTISGVVATEVSQTSALIQWQTDQPASSQVFFLGEGTPLDATLTLNHQVLVSGLLPGGTYEFTVVSVNADGLSTTSAPSSFDTLPWVVQGAQITSIGADFFILNGGLLPSDRVTFSQAQITYTGGTSILALGELVDLTGRITDTGSVDAKTLVVKPSPFPLSLGTIKLPKAKYATAYSVPIAPTGGVAPYSVSVTGLPPDLQFDGQSVSGMPMTLGTFAVVVSVTDARGTLKTKKISLTVAAPAVSLPRTLRTGTTGIPYLNTLKPTGGYGALTLTVTDLPPGLTLDGTVLSGIPTVAGNFIIHATAVDSLGTTLVREITVSVLAGAAPNYTLKDQGTGLVSAIGQGFIKVGSKFIVLDGDSTITANGKVLAVGSSVSWTGLRDGLTKIVHAATLTLN